MVDAVGTTVYTYAVGGQLYTEDGPYASDTVTNTYNNRLRVGMDLQQPTGVWTNQFAYDAAKRLTNVTSPAGSFAYLLPDTRPSHRASRIALPNTSYIANTYDINARLLSTALKNSSHTTLNSHAYAYNPGNQRTQQVFSAGSTYNYAYDKIGQLKVADSATASEDRGYRYDKAWNLDYRTNNGALTSFGVDEKNQLYDVGGAYVGYDDNGNLDYDEAHVDPLYYTYDDENRLVAMEQGWLRVEFVYDGLGRLRARMPLEWDDFEMEWAGAGNATYYLYDGMRVIQEREFTTPIVSYTRGTDLSGSLEGAGGISGLLARSHGYSGGNWSVHNFYHADGNGNVTYLVNSSQTLAASYRYDPYGNLISSSGGLASANKYRFSSKEFYDGTENGLSAVGLYYYGFRWYDPNVQRWLNRDPADDWGSFVNHVQNVRESEIDLNLFRFVANSPSVYVDTFGLTWRAGGNWDGKDDSIVCDNQGGIRPALTPNTQCGCDPAKKCRIEHEVSHAKDVLLENPDICHGKSDGTQIYTRNTKQNNASERRAYDKEIDCVQKNATAFNKECATSAADFIKKLKQDRKRYE